MSNRQEKVLALAVSLWIAGGGYGGMASAAGVTVNSPEDVEAKATGDDAVLIKKEYAEEVAPNVYVRDYWYTLKNDTDTELTIAGGDYTAAEYYLAARYMASGEGDASGGKLTVKAGQFTNHLYGGRSQDGKANNNTLIFEGNRNLSSLIGGKGKTGAAGNTVEMRGGEVYDIYGGIVGGVRTAP